MKRPLGLYQKYLLSFFLVIILPIVIATSVIHSYSVRMIQDEVHASNEQLLQSISEHTDDRIQEIQELLVYLSNKPNIESMVVNSRIIPEDDFVFRANEIKNEFSNLLSSQTYILDVYLFVEDKDYILSSEGLFTRTVFFERQNRYQNTTLRGILDALTLDDNFYVIPTKTINDTTQVVSVVARISTFGPKNGSLVINVDAEELFGSLRSLPETDSEALVLDARYNIMMHAGTSTLLTEHSHTVVEAISGGAGANERLLELGGVMSHVSILTSPETGWHYITLVPYRTLVSKAVSIRVLAIATVVFFLVLGAVVSYLLSRRFYNPVKTIVDRIRQYDGADGNDAYDELRMISDTIQTVYAENTRLESITRQNATLVQERCLYYLIKEGTLQIKADYRRGFEELESALDNRTIVPILLAFDYSTGAREGFTEKEQGILQSSLRLMLEQYAQDSADGRLVELETDQVCIVLTMRQYAQARAREIIEEVLTITDRFSRYVNVTVVAGHGLRNYYDLNQCYYAMLAALNTRAFCSTRQVLFIDEQPEEAENHASLVFERDKQLCNALVNGDYRHAYTIVAQTIESWIRDRVPHQEAKVLLMDLLTSVLHTLREHGIPYQQLVDSSFMLYEHLDGCNVQSDYEQFFGKLFRSITQYVEDSRTQDQNETLNRIIDFIEQNYADNQISLSVVADEAGMSMGYLSKYFKDNVGVNFVDYLNKKRIAHAKELLTDPQLKVYEIAEAVGYLSSNTFNIVFKKYEGISPGAYRRSAV